VDKDIDEREEAVPKHAKEKKSKRKWFWAPYLKDFFCTRGQYTDTLVPDSSFVHNNVAYTVVMNDSLRSICKEMTVVYFKVLPQHL
jgi:hypothetical protein